MTAKQLEETLTIIATKAKGLRDAGVFGLVRIGEIEFRLDSPDPVMLPAKNETEMAPINDPDTYGGEMPRRRGAPQHDEDDEE